MNVEKDNKIEVLGYPLFTKKFEKILEKSHKEKCFIYTINAYSFQVAKSDINFKEALLSANYLLPDGVGFVYAAKILNKVNIKKYAGFNLHQDILKHYNNTKGRIFYFGSTNETLVKIKEKIAIEFPNITVETLSPPFKDQFTVAENRSFINAINNFKPDVLFVGMTAPKQEKWVHEFKDYLNAKFICSIGAVFDFYAGNITRSPKWMIFIGLEWLYRSLKSWRLAKRNLSSNPAFIIEIFKNYFS